MKKIISRKSGLLTRVLFVLPFLLLTSLTAHAEDAPQAPAVVETFTCSYNSGQDMDDLMAARDYYVKQADKAGVTLGPAFMWSLFKGDVNFDFVWMAPHQSFTAFAAHADAEFAASELAGVQARFDAVADCAAGIGAIRQIHAKADSAPPSPAFITSNACRLNEGVGPAQLRDLGAHISEVMTEMGDAAPTATYAISPTTRGANTPHLVIFSVNESASSYAGFVSQLAGSPRGQMLIRHFSSIGQCGAAMWSGQQVITPPAAD